METENINTENTIQEKIEENIILEEKKQEKPKQKKCLLHSAFMPFLFCLFFAGIFYFFAYDLATIKYTDINDGRVTKIFSAYSVYFGLIAGIISMIGAYLLYFILKKLIFKQSKLFFPTLALLMISPWYFLARQLVYFENKYTDIAKALIYYIGEPMLATCRFLFFVILFWFFLVILKIIFKKNTKILSLFFALPFLLSGCVGNINEWACGFFDNPDHCLQNAAVQEGDSNTCEKIKGEDFADSGSNPPKDKCYLRIAENTGDLEVCKKIKGGLYSYTQEECILNTSVNFKNPSGCAMLSGADKKDCIEKVSPYVYPGSVIEIDDQINILKEELKKNSDEELEKQLAGLEKKKNDYLEVMNDNNKKTYESLSDPMNKKTSLDYHLGKIDEKTKDSLIALNDALRTKGDKLSDGEYKSLSEMLAYKNDPKNNIENMDDTEIVKLRWNEKVGNAVDGLKFWNSNKTEAEKKYDEQLLFYERMLERQASIEKGLSEKQQDFDRNSDMVKEYIKGKAWDAVMDEAKKQAFGELVDIVDSPASAPVTAVLGEAIDTVKKEAKSAEFRGLVRAYNKGMEEELNKAGGDIDKAHKAVIDNLQKNPYNYEDTNTFAKYGNLIENKDCDGSNPHCIQKDVFWKAMKKSYNYQNKK